MINEKNRYLNKLYLEEGSLDVVTLGRGYAWLDTGTMDGLTKRHFSNQQKYTENPVMENTCARWQTERFCIKRLGSEMTKHA